MLDRSELCNVADALSPATDARKVAEYIASTGGREISISIRIDESLRLSASMMLRKTAREMKFHHLIGHEIVVKFATVGNKN